VENSSFQHFDIISVMVLIVIVIQYFEKVINYISDNIIWQGATTSSILYIK